MKTPRIAAPVLTLAGLAALAAVPLCAEIEFSGYLKTGDATKFVLGDPAAQKKPAWFALGGVFDGYTIIGFDAKKETLAVEKAGTTTHLPLKPHAVPQVAQTDEAQQNSPYTLGPQTDERPRRERVLDGERRSVLRRKSELDGLLDRVGGSGGGAAGAAPRPVRIGDPGNPGGGVASESVALMPFTFQRDSSGTGPARPSAIPDGGRITIAPVNLTPRPPATHDFTLDFEQLRELEMRRVQSLPEAERQAAISTLEAAILKWKQERAQTPIVTRLNIPDWEQLDYKLRSYRERLQDLRTRYSEDHEWIRSLKEAIEQMEQREQGPAQKNPPDSVKKR